MDDSKKALPTSHIPKAIWGIGIAVFFVNLSSVMIRSLVPVYMRSLGVNMALIGLIEGIVEALSYVMKMLSGVFSDYLRRRKLIIVIGYAGMMIGRPIMALFANIEMVIFARVLDRLGNGIQATPRDALVGDLAPKDIRGACYGLRLSLGTAGSFAGALFGLVLLYWNNSDYQHVFMLSFIPAFIAVVIMIFFIKEPEQNLHPVDHQRRHPIHFKDLSRLSRPFWLLMIVVAVFMVGQLSEALMILHAHANFGLSDKNVPLILLVYNSTYSLSSYPVGRLSDTIGRYNLLAIGFLFLVAGDLCLALATNIEVVFLGVALSGVQMAFTNSLFMSLITDNVPEDLRGTGFGVYYFICAIAVLISNSQGGHIADIYGAPSAFIASGVMAALAFIALMRFKPKSTPAEKGLGVI